MTHRPSVQPAHRAPAGWKGAAARAPAQASAAPTGPAPTRRRWLAGLALAGAPLLLGACGFRLRGTATPLVFGRLQLSAPPHSPVARLLIPQLQASGVSLVAQPLPPGGAPPEVLLDIALDQSERAVAGTTAAGQVRELQLRQRLRFRLRALAGRELIPDTELLQQRELSFTEAQALGKEAEEALLFQDMQQALARQLMARLAALRSL